MTISELYIPHHKRCDEVFAAAEAAASDGRWAEALAEARRFAAMLDKHLASEETTLFPAFEDTTGMRSGPTVVMRSEHEQMRWLADAMVRAAEAQEAEGFPGLANTLLILMQQHNLKEESILYPMCDRALAGDAGLLARVQAQLE